MKKTRYNTRLRKSHRRLPFIVIWNQIFSNQKENKISHKSINYNLDFYDNLLPQASLTTNSNDAKHQIDYSYYSQVPYEKLENLYDCFHGILSYIFYYSSNKINFNELEFHFSGDDSSSDQRRNDDGKYNSILNIFDYENNEKKITISSTPNAFFCVTFKRIEIMPLCYSLRLGSFFNCNSFIVSFNFEGFNEETKKWDILDERLFIQYNSDGFIMFPVKTSNIYYSSFRIYQTERINDVRWGFDLIAFDIHGNVKYKESILDDLPGNHFDIDCSLEPINPCLDMTNFL